MDTRPITKETLAGSVIAVPPLARDLDGQATHEENVKIIRHIEAGGVTTLLYGGNAIFYHVSLREYAGILTTLREASGENTLTIPSVGPAYGMMMDQADILKDFDFPTVMLLPQQGVATSAGIASGFRRFVESFGKPSVLYIKFDGFMEIADVKRLVGDGLVSWIKYATVRDDPSQDDYLRALIDAVGTDLLVSGIGEQPAITHLRDFGLTSFTSGCVCVAPKLSMDMLRALQSGDVDTAESIRATFAPLEDLRNGINPIRVLHEAVDLAGIADTGPIIPLLSGVDKDGLDAIQQAAAELLAKNV